MLQLGSNGSKLGRRICGPALVAVAGLLALAGPSGAAEMDWEGSLEFRFGPSSGITTPPALTATGVATVDATAGHLDSLALDAGPLGSVLAPIASSVGGVTFTGIRISASQISGTFAPISGGGALTKKAVPVSGLFRYCLFGLDCSPGSAVTMPLTSMGSGVGLGGIVTTGGSLAVGFSIEAAPWTLGTATLTEKTVGGGFTFPTAMGFAHGHASGTSSTALASGVVQLVTPSQIVTRGFGESPMDLVAMFGVLKVHFVPEAGAGISLGAGALGLVLLWRRRRRSRG